MHNLRQVIDGVIDYSEVVAKDDNDTENTPQLHGGVNFIVDDIDNASSMVT